MSLADFFFSLNLTETDQSGFSLAWMEELLSVSAWVRHQAGPEAAQPTSRGLEEDL